MPIYTRMCFNTLDWVVPSGKSGKSISKDSFENLFGFGFEEWNFSDRHIFDGYKYMYLEGLRLYKPNRHDGHDLILYTRERKPKKSKVHIIGKINSSDWFFVCKSDSEKIASKIIKRDLSKDLRVGDYSANLNKRKEGFKNQTSNKQETNLDKKLPLSIFNLRIKEKSFKNLINDYKNNGLTPPRLEINLIDCKRYQLYVR